MMFPADAFEDRVALVTGGSDGIGRAIVLALAQAGATVYTCGRDESRGQRLREDSQSLPGQVHFIRCDLSDTTQGRALVDRIADETDALDYLVHNVADDRRLALEDVTDEAFDAQMNINLRPVFTLTQAVLGLLRRGQGKSICLIGTTNFMIGHAPFSLYGASKSALVGLTRSLARELGPQGMRVNMVSPGWVMTDKQKTHYVTEQDEADLLRDQCTKKTPAAGGYRRARAVHALASGWGHHRAEPGGGPWQIPAVTFFVMTL